MCQPHNSWATVLLAVIMVATMSFLVGTLPPHSEVEAATWVE